MSSGKSASTVAHYELDPFGIFGSKAPGSVNSSKPSGVPAPGAPPKQQGSANFYGNQLTSQTYQDPTYGTVTKYNPAPGEAEARTAAQAGINNILPTLGQTSAAEQKSYDEAANAYADNETQAFNRQYDPAVRAQREDYASRFGGGQNTAYIDAMGNMENQVRTPALLNIANNATQMKQQLYNNAQSQKEAQLQSLGYILNGNQSNFLQNLQNPQQVTNANNNFNQQNYSSLLQNYQFGQQQQTANTQALMQALGLAAGTALHA